MSVAVCPACDAAPLALAQAEEGQANVFLSLPGLHCATCIGTVERALMGVPGVRFARVNLSLRRVAVAADGPAEPLIAALDRAGYAAHPLDRDVLGKDRDPEGRALLFRIGLAGFAMMNVMLLSVAVWSGAEAATRDLFHLISALIVLPVIAFAGQPFFRSAEAALRGRRLNMDVPISLAILLSAGVSLVETLLGGRHAYFDASIALTFFLLVGRYLDHRSRAAARSAAAELAALEVQTAHLVGPSGTRVVPLADLAVGHEVMIPTGVRVPADGVLLSRKAETDRSFLTGESAAVHLSEGDAVQAGEVNLGAPFRLRATAVGADTTLRRVAALVETAESAKNRYTALADRAARIYSPTVHLLALGSFAGWLAVSGDPRLSINIAIAVLIITCPCALGLAVPAVSTAAIGRLFAAGFLVKSGTALERLAEVDTVVFDKTGTLTLPGLAIDPGALSPEAQGVARALAQASVHPVSRAVVAALPDGPAADVEGIEEVPGAGVRGLWQGREVRLGRADWIGGGAGGPSDGPGLALGDEIASLPIVERLRPGAAEAVAALQARGLEVRLLSGDRESAVEDIARRLGIAVWDAGVPAEAKHGRLAALAERGRRVAMIGDGLNDAASLAAAHASLAPSSALDAARNAADIVILKEGFEGLAEPFAVAAAAVRLSRQNFVIAAAYNLVAVPVALAGLATPLIAALAMSTSSVTVLLNALRVRWVR